ncbi:hypothetical protein [Antrihabitans stalactiti]|nr:hypothetical protein [Antrihabitans stalactiti]
MLLAALIAGWTVVSVPAALLVGRIIANGHRNDPRPYVDPEGARGASVHH